jgi:speckle-type POZ protein
MAFAGVSVIARGKLLAGPTTPSINAGAASGYHLLVVEGYSRTYDRISPASRCFTIGGHRWCISYYPYGYSSDDAGFISLVLFNYDGSSGKAQFEFSFIDETEKQDPARIRVFEISGSQFCNRFVKRDALQMSKHFKDDSFTIRCDVVVADEDVTSLYVDVPPSNMKQNFTNLLLAGEGTDVVFHVRGETFAAHRSVLVARSAVFKASLFGPMKEGSASAVVQIDDMDATVFKTMLGFIYGDSLLLPAELNVEDKEEEGNDEEGVALLQHLLVAADRYDLPRLRAMCEKRLCEHISVTTSTTMLTTGKLNVAVGQITAVCLEHGRQSLYRVSKG